MINHSVGVADVAWASDRARAVRERFGMPDTQACDPRGIAREEKLKIVELPLIGVEALLSRSQRKIILSNRIASIARRNFTIAHELGHWFLHGGRSQGNLCTTDDISGYTRSPMEKEANAFASELLIPSTRAAEMAVTMDVSIATAVRVSGHFHSSVTAALLALVSVTNRARILVACRGDRIAWVRKSPSAQKRFIELGQAVDIDSVAYACTTELSDLDEQELKDLPADVASAMWLPRDFEVDDWQLTEESIWIPYQRTVLVLLSLEARYE